MTDVDRLDDAPYAAAHLLASRRGIRPCRLRLLGLDLPALFTGGGTASRTDHTVDWESSWTALLDGDTITVAIRILRTD
jgi:hypothetical protein